MIGGLLLSGCASDVLAGVVGNGEARLALSDVGATNDWQGNENDSTVWGIVVDYIAKQRVRDFDCVFTGNIDYSKQSANDKDVMTTDNIRLRMDGYQEFRQNLRAHVAMKDLRHFKNDDHTTFLKIGIAKSDGFELRKATSSTSPLRVIYTVGTGLSIRYTNAGEKREGMGVLCEANLCALRGDWGFRIKDADVFIHGINQNSFEIPLSIEYSPKKAFISYDICIRGTNKQAGALRTIRAGFRQQF